MVLLVIGGTLLKTTSLNTLPLTYIPGDETMIVKKKGLPNLIMNTGQNVNQNTTY